MVTTSLTNRLAMPEVVELRDALLVLRDDRSAKRLEALYRNYLARVYTICRRLLAGPKAAEAATVEVFVRFSRELPCW